MTQWLSPNLPNSPLKELNRELHEQHRKAGYPSVRKLHEAIGEAVSHTKIHHAFTKPKVPSWGIVELVVEVLAAQARPRMDPEAEVDRFKALWDRASASRSGTTDHSQADAASAQAGGARKWGSRSLSGPVRPGWRIRPGGSGATWPPRVTQWTSSYA